MDALIIVIGFFSILFLLYVLNWSTDSNPAMRYYKKRLVQYFKELCSRKLNVAEIFPIQTTAGNEQRISYQKLRSEWEFMSRIFESWFVIHQVSSLERGNCFGLAVSVSRVTPKYKDFDTGTIEQLLEHHLTSWLSSSDLCQRLLDMENAIWVEYFPESGSLFIMVAASAKGCSFIQQLKRDSHIQPDSKQSLSIVPKNYELVVGYDLEELQSRDVLIPIILDISKNIHLLITGATGSGKSIACTYLMYGLSQIQAPIHIYLLDFKGGTFSEFKDYKYFYEREECFDAVEMFYEDFKKCQRGEKMPNGISLLIYDEFPASMMFLSESSISLDKAGNSSNTKQIAAENKARAKRIQSQITEMLLMSRSFGYGIWLICQRPDSSLFGSSGGARDNFMATYSLGNASPQAKTMMFSGFELPERRYQPGEGIFLKDGSEPVEVKVPFFSEEELCSMKDSIKEWLLHSSEFSNDV